MCDHKGEQHFILHVYRSKSHNHTL